MARRRGGTTRQRGGRCVTISSAHICRRVTYDARGPSPASHDGDRQPCLPELDVDRAGRDRARELWHHRRAGDVRRRREHGYQGPGARGRRRHLGRRDAPMVFRAELLQANSGYRAGARPSQGWSLRLRHAAEVQGGREALGAGRTGHRRRAEVRQSQHGQASQGDVPRPAYDHHPHSSRRGVQRPNRDVVGVRQGDQRGAEGGRRGRGRVHPARRAIVRDHPRPDGRMDRPVQRLRRRGRRQAGAARVLRQPEQQAQRQADVSVDVSRS